MAANPAPIGVTQGESRGVLRAVDGPTRARTNRVAGNQAATADAAMQAAASDHAVTSGESVVPSRPGE